MEQEFEIFNEPRSFKVDVEVGKSWGCLQSYDV
jgi:hypothetical protein